MKYIKQNYLKLLQRWMSLRERDFFNRENCLIFYYVFEAGKTHTHAHIKHVLFYSIFIDSCTWYTLIVVIENQ